MASDTVKSIKIKTGADSYDEKPIGASAQDIDVYYDGTGKASETETGSQKTLVASLNELDEKITNQVNRAETNIVGTKENNPREESDDEANGNHAAGSYFLYDGYLAKATQAIAAQGPLQGKYVSTDVGSELQSVNTSVNNINTTLANNVAMKSDLGTQATYSVNGGVLTITTL